MAHLFNRNVLLGVSGGIAAYKAAELVRQLQEHGANVRVVMTQGAQEFITPLTLQALSGNPVHTQLLDTGNESADVARPGHCAQRVHFEIPRIRHGWTCRG